MVHPCWGYRYTHTVCVCTMHQNIILLLLPLGISYKELIPFFVCAIGLKDCMMRRCEKCLETSNALRDHLYEIVGDYDEEDEIEYKQWTTTDRSTLVNCSDNIPQYIEIVIKQLLKLTPHSHIAKIRSQYLKNLKSNLNSESVMSW